MHHQPREQQIQEISTSETRKRTRLVSQEKEGVAKERERNRAELLFQ